jgi:hypothetical protein
LIISLGLYLLLAFSKFLPYYGIKAYYKIIKIGSKKYE